MTMAEDEERGASGALSTPLSFSDFKTTCTT